MDKIRFGTEVQENGVFFRLYAPSLEKLTLVLNEKEILMAKAESGFFETFVAGAKTGDSYGFKLPDGLVVADSASRFQPDGVHGLSMVVDNSFNWDKKYKVKSFEELIFYELHVGAFSKEGSFKGVENNLDYLKKLGINAIELMPVADFGGNRGWGYDGVLLFAPKAEYGTPEDLKALINSAHKKEMAVFLDVVYNHFGPDGNYLYCYAKDEFFDTAAKTPWGDGIRFDNPVVREFFISNAIYWLKEYNFDGLRLDAVHEIPDKSFLTELANRVKKEFGDTKYLVLENDKNQASLLNDEFFTAQWNDDFHHVAHAAITDEKTGYYRDYLDKPISHYLAKVIAEGFAYQGEASPYRYHQPRGESSKALNPMRFVNFIQNHDQVGNRALGERIGHIANAKKLKCLTALYLLIPSAPMIFMGEEWRASNPFLFFCGFDGELGNSVREGRKREFSAFENFSNVEIPDPTDIKTFKKSQLNWAELKKNKHKESLDFYKKLIKLRKKYIIPLIKNIHNVEHEILDDSSLKVSWETTKNDKLELYLDLANDFVEFKLNGGIVFLLDSF